MKRLITSITFLMIFVFVSGAFAEKTNQIQKKQLPQLSVKNEWNSVPFNLPATKEVKKTSKSMAVSTDTVGDMCQMAQDFLQNNTPFVYDPVSQYYFMARRNIIYVDNFINQVEVYLAASKDLKNWDSVYVMRDGTVFAYYPSVAIPNKTETNINNIPLCVMSQGMVVTGNLLYGRGELVNSGTKNNMGVEFYDSPSNDPAQYFGAMKIMPYFNEGDSYVIGCGQLINEFEGDWGKYGFLGWDLAQNDVYVQTSPPQWGKDKFITGAYQNANDFDFDTEGGIYMAVANIFSEDADDYFRLPGVSKSTDGGLNWSDFNKMPRTTLENYINSQGYENGIIRDAYGKDAFVVTGVDKWSFFTRIAMWHAGSDIIEEKQMIEAYYNNGAWGIRKVATVPIANPMCFWRDNQKSEDIGNPDSLVWRYSDNPIGIELQVSKTADGKALILKWLEPTVEQALAEPFIATFWQDNEARFFGFDTLTLNNVVFSYRGINDNSWKAKSQKTLDSDGLNYKGTWIPPVVPDLQHVAMCFQKVPDITNPQYFAFNYPPAVQQMLISYIPQHIMTQTFNLGTGDVEETPENYNFNVCEVYPNPVSNNAEFAFELDRASQVKIEIFNSLGQLVKVVYNQYTNAGLHGINADLSNLNDGAYYFTLTAGNVKTTKVLNVLK